MNDSIRSRCVIRDRRAAKTRTQLHVEVLEDRAVPSVNITESEPNNSPAQANPVPRVLGDQVIVSGRVATPGDRDWFRLELQAGDVVGASMNGRGGLNAAVRLVNATGDLLIGNDDGRGVGGLLPKESPLPRSEAQRIDATVYYVVPAAGAYFLEAAASGDATTGSYNLELAVARPGLERQPVGTHQTLFLDFDGAAVNFSHFVGGLSTGTKQLSPLSSFLSSWGMSPADENAVIDGVLAKVRQKLSAYVRANGLNGDYAETGVAGQFDLEIRTSRDNADMFGKNPFVARVVVGGTPAETGLPANIWGYAQDVDPGNFKTDDDAVAFLHFIAQGLAVVPIAPPATVLDFVTEGIATVVAHEAGHLFGCFHTEQSAENPSAGTPSLMDPDITGVLGPDGIYGTPDDRNVQLVGESYLLTEPFRGLDDTLNTVSFGLSTGKGAGHASMSMSAGVASASTGSATLPGNGTGGAAPIGLTAGSGSFVGHALWVGDEAVFPTSPAGESRTDPPVSATYRAEKRSDDLQGRQARGSVSDEPVPHGVYVGDSGMSFAPPDSIDELIGFRVGGRRWWVAR